MAQPEANVNTEAATDRKERKRLPRFEVRPAGVVLPPIGSESGPITGDTDLGALRMLVRSLPLNKYGDDLVVTFTEDATEVG